MGRVLRPGIGRALAKFALALNFKVFSHTGV
jgi:hypothetical protein